MVSPVRESPAAYWNPGGFFSIGAPHQLQSTIRPPNGTLIADRDFSAILICSARLSNLGSTYEFVVDRRVHNYS
jgi:hypothetical protein